MEAALHLPVSVWVVPALRRMDPRVPLVLFGLSVQMGVTTAVCLVELFLGSGKHVAWADKLGLLGTYGTYVVLGELST